jgi:hypothetical protein
MTLIMVETLRFSLHKQIIAVPFLGGSGRFLSVIRQQRLFSRRDAG